MSRRYDILWNIAYFAAVREIPQREITTLIFDVLSAAGQIDCDYDSDDNIQKNLQEIEKDVSSAYAKILGYQDEIS